MMTPDAILKSALASIPHGSKVCLSAEKPLEYWIRLQQQRQQSQQPPQHEQGQKLRPPEKPLQKEAGPPGSFNPGKTWGGYLPRTEKAQPFPPGAYDRARDQLTPVPAPAESPQPAPSNPGQGGLAPPEKSKYKDEPGDPALMGPNPPEPDLPTGGPPDPSVGAAQRGSRPRPEPEAPKPTDNRRFMNPGPNRPAAQPAIGAGQGQAQPMTPGRLRPPQTIKPRQGTPPGKVPGQLPAAGPGMRLRKAAPVDNFSIKKEANHPGIVTATHTRNFHPPRQQTFNSTVTRSGMSDKQREELQTKGELHHGDYHYKINKMAKGEPATKIPTRGMGNPPQFHKTEKDKEEGRRRSEAWPYKGLNDPSDMGYDDEEENEEPTKKAADETNSIKELQHRSGSSQIPYKPQEENRSRSGDFPWNRTGTELTGRRSKTKVDKAAGEGTMTKVPQDYTGHEEHKPRYLPHQEASPPRGHYGNKNPNSIPLTVPQRDLVQKARSALKAMGFRPKDR